MIKFSKYAYLNKNIGIIIGLGLIVALGLYLTWQVPIDQLSKIDDTSISPLEFAKLENEFRATMAQIFGGLLLLLGIYLTWRRISAMEQTVEITQKGQITERFTRAIDQLGNDKLEVKTGGIYALERIANESSEDYWPIVEILTSYIRKNSPIEPVMGRDGETIDIEAVINVLRRRKHYYGNGESSDINLKMTFLRLADLHNINLKGANLTEANLEGANLTEANLAGANLAGAHLERANFRDAHLENAFLWDVHLEKAKLIGAYLEGADLMGAHLEGANLRGAHLKGANLAGAHLERANFRDAHLEGADLFKAHLEGANFRDANLEDVQFPSKEELSKVETFYGAKFSEDISNFKMAHPHLFESNAFANAFSH